MSTARSFLALIIATLLVPAGVLWAQEEGRGHGDAPEATWTRPPGYQPLPPPPARVDARGPEESAGDKGDEGTSYFHDALVRLSYRRTWLDGGRIGRSEGIWQGAEPTLSDAFADSNGVALDFVWPITPFFSIQYSLSYEVFRGRTVTSAVDRVRFDDLHTYLTSIGPRLTLPLGLDPARWNEAADRSKVRGLVPYVRLGVGYALHSEVDVRLADGRKVGYFAKSDAGHAVFAFGLEFRTDRLGAFIEAFAIESCGKLSSVREPEGRDAQASGYPISFGLVWQF
jgi:hypothetical protein